jgi:hypothetical protein
MAISEFTKNIHLETLENDRREPRKSQSKSDCIKSSCPRPFSIQKNINSSSLIKSVPIPEIVDSLKEDGFSLGINLHQDIVREIWDFANRTLCYGNNDPSLGFYYSQKEQAQTKYGHLFKIGTYYKKTSLCSVIKQLESDPILLEIAAQYLEAEPISQGNQLWWHFPVDSPIYDSRHSLQMFHREGKKRRVLKFLFYITDVDLCSSPPVCVRGSHVRKHLSPLYRHRESSYQEIADYYGYQNIVPICGKSGSGFAEDTRCFHKKSPPGSTERLTLQIKLAVKD